MTGEASSHGVGGDGEIPTLLTKPEILRKIPVSLATFDRMVAEGRFPKPVKLSKSRVAWLESEVRDWLSARINQRGNS